MEKEFEDHASGLEKADEFKEEQSYSPEDADKYNYSNLLDNLRRDNQSKTPRSKSKSAQKVQNKSESAVKAVSPKKTPINVSENETDEHIRMSIKNKLFSAIDDY